MVRVVFSVPATLRMPYWLYYRIRPWLLRRQWGPLIYVPPPRND